MKRIGALVRGRVQGVGFRYFAQSKAGEQALIGWVRNTPDGNVELEAQGPEESIAGFIADLKNGPRIGHVEDVRICELPLLKSESGFEIRY
jgi:acylphosphatase